jgi:hypothetical protein
MSRSGANRERFPSDFLFQLTKEEAESLRSQTATLKRGRRLFLVLFFFDPQIQLP